MYDNLDDHLLECEPDPEYESRIEADRVTAEWRTPLRPKVPQRDYRETPMFGSLHEQWELF